MTVTEQITAALEAEIRERVKHRRWYRTHRETYNWPDLERENERALRLLFSVRRDGIREQRRVDAAMRAHREAVEAAEWGEAARTGQYPDVPLAARPRTEDPGDIFVYPGAA